MKMLMAVVLSIAVSSLASAWEIREIPPKVLEEEKEDCDYFKLSGAESFREYVEKQLDWRASRDFSSLYWRCEKSGRDSPFCVLGSHDDWNRYFRALQKLDWERWTVHRARIIQRKYDLDMEELENDMAWGDELLGFKEEN